MQRVKYYYDFQAYVSLWRSWLRIGPTAIGGYSRLIGPRWVDVNHIHIKSEHPAEAI